MQSAKIEAPIKPLTLFQLTEDILVEKKQLVLNSVNKGGKLNVPIIDVLLKAEYPIYSSDEGNEISLDKPVHSRKALNCIYFRFGGKDNEGILLELKKALSPIPEIAVFCILRGLVRPLQL